MQLTKEIEDIKSLHNNIFNLLSNYAKSQSEGGAQGKECCSTAAATLHLLPENRCDREDEAAVMAVKDINPKLFGVAIGTKRARKEERCGEDNTVLSLDQPVYADVKSKPLDLINCEKRKTLWLNRCYRENKSVCN
jgi:heat shock transcription factor